MPRRQVEGFIRLFRENRSVGISLGVKQSPSSAALPPRSEVLSSSCRGPQAGAAKPTSTPAASRMAGCGPRFRPTVVGCHDQPFFAGTHV